MLTAMAVVVMAVTAEEVMATAATKVTLAGVPATRAPVQEMSAVDAAAAIRLVALVEAATVRVGQRHQ